MADSMLVAGIVELLGGGKVLDSGPGAGASFMLGNGYKLGAPAIDNDTVQSLLLDGEVPYGERASNRDMEIPVEIFAPGRIKLMQAREQLLQLVDVDGWELTLQLDGMLPMIFTCFRATFDIDQTSLVHEKQDYCRAFLTFQAFPYARSTDLQTIPIVQSSGAQVPPVVIDGFDDANVGPGWFLDKTHKIQGSASIYNLNTGWIGASRQFSPLDLSAMSGLRIWTTMAGIGNSRAFRLSLVDDQGRQYYLGEAQHLLRGNYAWERINWQLKPQDDFDLTSVTGYFLAVSGPVYLDQLSAAPQWLQSAVTARGAVVTVPGVLGTARAPVNLQLSWASGAAHQQFLVHKAPKYAPILYTPMVPYDSTAVPDGTTQLAPPLVDGVGAGPRWNGSHVVYVCFTTFGAAGTRTVTVNFRQYWNDAGIGPTDHDGKSVSAVVDATQALVPIGSIDLPIVSMAADNSATTWTVSVQSTNTSDRFGEILVLDTRGETMFMSSARTAKSFWVDAPNPLRDPFDFVGKVVGGSSRSSALDVSGEAAMPWLPFSADPGDNSYLTFSPQEVPDATFSLYPNWRTVRLQ